MKRLFVFLFLFISFFQSYAQVIAPETNKISSVDYKRLKNIDTILNKYVNNNYINGIVTLIIKDNTIVQYKGYGYANLETHKPMQRNAIFRIMSQTKAITSAGIMILFEK